MTSGHEPTAPVGTRQLRVDHVITKLATGGAQESALVVCSGLDRVRFSQRLLYGPEVDAEGSVVAQAEARGVDLVPLRNLGRAPDLRRDVAAVAELVRQFRTNRTDLVHTHSSKAGFLGRLAARIAHVPVIHSVHGWSFHDRTPPVLRAAVIAAERLAARGTAVLVVVSSPDLEKGLEAGIGRRSQYRLVRNGIDLDRFRPAPDTRIDARAELGVAPDGPLVGTVGRLAEQKNPLGMVDAFAALRVGCPEARFVWIGDGPFRPALEARIDQLGLSSSFQILGVRRDVPRLLQALDVFALSSHWEGLPLTITEAMASGVPVVATAVDGVADAVVHGETGMLVADDDMAGLAAAIAEVLTCDDLAAQLREGGRERAKRFDRATMLDALAAVYVQVDHDHRLAPRRRTTG